MIPHKNRGLAFEMLIEHANRQYQHKGRAIIQKVPVSWKVIRRGDRIVSAYPEKKSTVDFIGVAHGRPIAFDAKSTRERTRFPLNNLENHQYEFLQQWRNQGGIAFLLLEFAVLKESYLIPFKVLEKHWQIRESGGRQSIRYQDIRFECDLIRSDRGIALDYLKKII